MQTPWCRFKLNPETIACSFVSGNEIYFITLVWESLTLSVCRQSQRDFSRHLPVVLQSVMNSKPTTIDQKTSLCEGLVQVTTSVQSHQFRSAKNDVSHRWARNVLKKILYRMLVDMPRQSTTSPADTLICENNWQVVEQSLSVGSVLEARKNVIIEWLYALLGYKRKRR